MSSKLASALLPKLGLSARHRIIAEGGIPPLQYEFEREKWAMAERFGQYGQKSGVDIRQLWPSIEEVEEIKALRMYRKASEAQTIAKEKTEQEELRYKNKLEKIEKSWKDHNRMLAEYYEERDNVSDQKKIEEEELQKNIRRVQEYFGYWVDTKDPRFQLMLSELDETAKMEAKLERKKLRKQRSSGGTGNSQPAND